MLIFNATTTFAMISHITTDLKKEIVNNKNSIDYSNRYKYYSNKLRYTEFGLFSSRDPNGRLRDLCNGGGCRSSATRVLLGTHSLYLVHRQSLWGSLSFQQQECFQTVLDRREYQCLVDTQHPCLCSDSPNGTECLPSHWERNSCLHRGHQRWPERRLASPTCLAGSKLWGRELNGCPGTVVFDLSKS